jgi:hypothetical protein
VVVGNDGSLSVPPGILTHVTVSGGGESFDLGAFATTEWLLPGQSEELEVVFELPPAPEIDTIIVTATVDDDGAGAGQYNECDEADNALVSNPISCLVVQ